MCKFTFKKLISLILCGSAMNCSAAFAMDPESRQQNSIVQNLMMDQDLAENSPISVNNLSPFSISEDSEDLENYISNIPGEGPLPANLLNNNEEHYYQNEDEQLVNAHNQAPSNNAGENGDVDDYAQAVNKKIYQNGNANSKGEPEFLQKKRNSLPDYFPSNFTDGYLWKFEVHSSAPSTSRALTRLLQDNPLIKQQFTDSRLFAPAGSNNNRRNYLKWAEDVVTGRLKELDKKLHRKFFNKISKLIGDASNTEQKRSKYVPVELSTPFGTMKASLVPKGKSLIPQEIKLEGILREFKKLDEQKQKLALNIIRAYFDESEGGNYSVGTSTGLRGCNYSSITIDDPRYNGTIYSGQFTKTELSCLKGLFFDLVYRLPNKYNDSGIFEIAYINWYLNKLGWLSND